MEVLEPVEARAVIPYPTCPNEFEVQARLYSELRRMRIDVRGEVVLRGAFDTNERKSQCRFDLVVFRQKRPVAIVEVKSAPRQYKHGTGKTRQETRYVRFGVPVYFIRGAEQADALLRAVETDGLLSER